MASVPENTLGSRIKFDEERDQTLRLGVKLRSGRFENYTALTYINVDQSATNQILSGIYTDAAGGLYNLPAAAASAVFGPVCTHAVALGLETSVDDCVASRYKSLIAIRAALIAGTPWLDVFCPGCGTSQAIELRKVNRHPLASVANPGAGVAVPLVPRGGANAEDPRFARAPASGEDPETVLNPRKDLIPE